MKGECVPLSRVPDPTFADGLLGKGVAIIPADGNVYAPADGEVTMAFQTGHAVAMTTADGIEVLVHIGWKLFRWKASRLPCMWLMARRSAKAT